jgi:hypothetical protein
MNNAASACVCLYICDCFWPARAPRFAAVLLTPEIQGEAMKIVNSLAASAFVLLAGCAAQPVGNELGGIVKADRRFTSTDSIFRAAEAHCAKFGKSARATAPHQNGQTVFECE